MFFNSNVEDQKNTIIKKASFWKHRLGKILAHQICKRIRAFSLADCLASSKENVGT